MKRISDHKHIPTRKYNNCLCLVCGAIIDSLVLSPKANEMLFEIEQYPIELFYNLKAQETPRKSATPKEKQLRRKLLIDKLLLIKKKLRLSSRIFHLTVYLTDSIIENSEAVKYEHIGLGCLLLAVKFLQIESEIPDMKQFEVKMNDVFYSNEELKRFEVYCVIALQYKLNVVTPIDFIEYFASKGLLFLSELSPNTKSSGIGNDISNNLNANSLLTTIHEILLKIANRLSYTSASSLHIACACVSLAREHYGLKQKWHPAFASVYKTQFADFEKVYELIKHLYNESQKTSMAYSKVIVPAKVTLKEESIRSGDFFLKKRKQRTLSLGVNSSFLNQYIKQNINSFHIKERVKQHSNESSCKKETAQSINATPENIPLIPLRKYKYQNMNFPISNNMTIISTKLSMNHYSKQRDTFECTMMNTTDKMNDSKHASRKIFQGYKFKSSKEPLNNSLVGTSDQAINLKKVIQSYCKANSKKQRPLSGSKSIAPI